MNNILTANFFRMFKSKFFWTLTVSISIFVVFLMILGAKKDIENDLHNDLDYYFFFVIPLAGLIFSTFSSMFWGTEFSDGTIRNKIVIGNKREVIYISDLLVSFVAVTVFSVAWLLGNLAGIPHFGLLKCGFKEFSVKFLLIYCTFLALTAIFNFTSHMITNKPASVVVSIFLAFALILLGSYFVNSLQAPQYIYNGITITQDGVEYGDFIKNPSFVDGSLRKIYEIVSYILPTGQQIWLSDSSYVPSTPLLMASLSITMTVFTTILGYFSFKRKELK